MPKPRRRRRFFALEGRFEVGDTGELEGIADSSRLDAAASPPPLGDEDAFVRDGEAKQAGYAETPVSEAASDEETLPPAFRLNRTSRVRSAPSRLFSPLSLLLSLACLCAGLVAGYLWARNGQKPVATNAPDNALKSTNILTPTDEDELDAAYAARHAHKFEEAERFFAALERRHPDWGPMKVEFGRTLFYESKVFEATAALKTAAEKGWKPAEANFLLGVLQKARKSFPEAEQCFARSVAIDPTQPEYYFFWGECLREEGKLLDATAKFRSALLRNQYETATGLYQAKLWLCAIEAGQEGTDGISNEVDAALASPQPPMEAFVAAAARDLKAGHFDAAKVYLVRARQRADETVFLYVLSDPLFQQARARPELAEFFPSAPSATGSEPVPPAPSQPPISPVK